MLKLMLMLILMLMLCLTCACSARRAFHAHRVRPLRSACEVLHININTLHPYTEYEGMLIAEVLRSTNACSQCRYEAHYLSSLLCLVNLLPPLSSHLSSLLSSLPSSSALPSFGILSCIATFDPQVMASAHMFLLVFSSYFILPSPRVPFFLHLTRIST